MNLKLSLIALGVAVAVGTPAAAHERSSTQRHGAMQQQSKAQPQDAQQAAERRKSIVTASGTVVSRVRIRPTGDEDHEVLKLRTPSGRTVVADLGVTGDQPTFKRGDRVIVSGRAGRVNGKPVVFATHAGLIQQVGSAARSAGTRHAQQQQQQAAHDTGWVVLTFTPIAVVSAQDQRREALFAALDANRDLGISRSEARRHPQIAANFRRIDRNGDGRLGWTEFGQLQIGARHQQRQQPDQQRSGGFQPAGGQAGMPSSKDKASYPRRTLRLLDDDGNSAISPVEAADLPRLTNRFDQLDADGDGVLTRDELRPDVIASIWRGSASQQGAGNR